MPTVPAIRSNIDALVAPLWAAFVPWQVAYRAASTRDRYWQGLAWPRTRPDDDVPRDAPDAETDAYPHDRSAVRWRRVIRECVGAMPTPLLRYWRDMRKALRDGTPPPCRCTLECQEWHANDGRAGFALKVTFTKDGKTHLRILGYNAPSAPWHIERVDNGA